MRTRTILAAVVLAALPLSACASGSAASSAPAKAKAAATRKTLPAVPDTAAAAKSAAVSFLALYSAGQWQAAWQLLTTADQKQVPEARYAAFHVGCPPESAGMAYAIKNVTPAGRVAVITYTIPVLSSLGSATATEQWTAAGWRWELDSISLAAYGHGTVAADVKAAKAAGQCASS